MPHPVVWVASGVVEMQILSGSIVLERALECAVSPVCLSLPLLKCINIWFKLVRSQSLLASRQAAGLTRDLSVCMLCHDSEIKL